LSGLLVKLEARCARVGPDAPAAIVLAAPAAQQQAIVASSAARLAPSDS
jgi:hypothetical protein